MRPALFAILLTAAVLGYHPPAALAQNPAPKFVEVELRDGSKLYGSIASEDASQIILQTIAGNAVTLTRVQVKRINATAGEVVDGEFWPDDVVSSKLFLGATGRSLKRGEGDFGVDSLFLPVFQVGVTDRFSIGVGAPFYGFVKTAWITPKLQLWNNGKTAISTGVLHLFVPDFGIGGYGYVVGTHGTPNGAVTFGGGLLYGRDDDKTATTPMFSIGGEKRLSRRTKLVTENYIFKEGVVVTVGTRIIGQTISTELGGIVFVGDGEGMPGVFFNFVFHGRPKAAGR